VIAFHKSAISNSGYDVVCSERFASDVLLLAIGFHGPVVWR